MARWHVVKAGDKLGKVSLHFYRDPALGPQLGLYNGLRNPNLIVIGQRLEIPPRIELLGRSRPAPGTVEPTRALLQPPHGLEAILEVFGNLPEYISDDGGLDPRFETEFLTRVALPFPIPLAWDRSRSAARLHCHRTLQDVLPAVFSRIRQDGLQAEVRTFGGCFNFRAKRTSGKFSTHCWGIAVDLNPETNTQGTPGDMSERVVHIFREHGFTWGGEWTGRSRDPMHFQFCTGY